MPPKYNTSPVFSSKEPKPSRSYKRKSKILEESIRFVSLYIITEEDEIQEEEKRKHEGKGKKKSKAKERKRNSKGKGKRNSMEGFVAPDDEPLSSLPEDHDPTHPSNQRIIMLLYNLLIYNRSRRRR